MHSDTFYSVPIFYSIPCCLFDSILLRRPTEFHEPPMGHRSRFSPCSFPSPARADGSCEGLVWFQHQERGTQCPFPSPVSLLFYGNPSPPLEEGSASAPVHWPLFSIGCCQPGPDQACAKRSIGHMKALPRPRPSGPELVS